MNGGARDQHQSGINRIEIPEFMGDPTVKVGRFVCMQLPDFPPVGDFKRARFEVNANHGVISKFPFLEFAQWLNDHDANKEISHARPRRGQRLDRESVLRVLNDTSLAKA